MSGGFVKIHNSLWDNPVFRSLSEAGVFAWMIHRAVWELDGRKVRRNSKLFQLKRGQLILGYRDIMRDFDMSERKARTFLKNLIDDSMIVAHTEKRESVITICNYNKYQLTPNHNNSHEGAPNDAQSGAQSSQGGRTVVARGSHSRRTVVALI